MEDAGLQYDFVQDNHSSSTVKGTLRGIHFQKGQWCQAKLVRCTRGAVLDVAVDLRPESPTYGQYETVLLSGENQKQFFVPRGFAHGFLVLSETTTFFYKCDNFYAPESEGALAWDDPDLGIDWRIPAAKVILSEKDRHHPCLKDACDWFDYNVNLYE